MGEGIVTEVDGVKVKLTNLDKMLYPNVGFIKAEVIQYYQKVAPLMLRYITTRPLTLIRYPDGIEGKKFYSKDMPKWAPDWVGHARIADDDNKYVVATKTADLVWLANLAALEIHPMQVRGPGYLYPDHFIFDLDPSPSFSFSDLKQIAYDLGEFLRGRGYVPYIKTSGSKGLHIYVPIKAVYGYEEFYESVKKMAQDFVVKFPSSCTLRMSKERRLGKVLLDIYRNHRHNSCVAPYSLRAKAGAPISMPFVWSDLEAVKSSQQFKMGDFVPGEDAWNGFWNQAVELHNKRARVMAVKLPSYKPMLASAAEIVPQGDYVYEVKWDGLRALIFKQGDEVKVISRSGSDLTEKFPELVESLDVGEESVVLDGEIVVLDERGVSDFPAVISRLHSAKVGGRRNAVYYAFDLLNLSGKDLVDEPFMRRRELLAKVIKKSKVVRISDVFDDGQALYDAGQGMGIEGIMAKVKDGKYEVGGRSKNWIKVKYRSELQAVIIGYTEGEGDRWAHFGALHLAEYVDEELNYIGKVGSGFKGEDLQEVMKLLLEVPKSRKLIDEIVEEESRTVWLVPMLRCNIRYASRTKSGTLREPVFIRMIRSLNL